MATRRAALLTAAGVSAGTGLVLAGLASTASASTTPIPRTLARRNTGLGRGVRIDSTEFRLSHLAIGWTGPVAPALRVRTTSGWADWQQAHACHGGKDGTTATQSWALLTVPGATGYELDAAGGTTNLSATELNTVDGPTRTTAAAPAAAVPLGTHPARHRYLSRGAWGADESLRYNPDGSLAWGPTQYFPTQTLTVHHTAGVNNDPDPAATVRAIYYYDTVTQGWGDMGYHLLIDEAGSVYEGRWSGDDPIPVFGPTPGADGQPLMVTGAHVQGYNSGNTGVVLLGDFTNQQPTPAARTALTAVLAVLGAVTVLDPLGITDYVNPVSGATKTVDTISGHRDWAATQCPGNTFYPQLPSVRQDVARLLGH